MNNATTLSTSATVNIGLVNPKSPTNVGAVMRAAGCFNAGNIYYSGERFDRAVKFHTDTKNIIRQLELQHVKEFDTIKGAAKLVCIELTEGAIALPEFEHPQQALYLFGPEDGSLSQQQINQADAVVYIPTTGCLNLAATVNIVLYDRMAKQQPVNSGDALIRQSRDTNNKTRVGTP